MTKMSNTINHQTYKIINLVPPLYVRTLIPLVERAHIPQTCYPYFLPNQVNFLLPFMGFGFNYTWLSLHGHISFRF